MGVGRGSRYTPRNDHVLDTGWYVEPGSRHMCSSLQLQTQLQSASRKLHHHRVGVGVGVRVGVGVEGRGTGEEARGHPTCSLPLSLLLFELPRSIAEQQDTYRMNIRYGGEHVSVYS